MAEPPAGFPPELIKQLQDTKQIYVATARQDGTRSAAVPVWFGVMNNAIWFATKPKSVKAKRINRGSQVFVSIWGQDGPFMPAKAEVVKDGTVADQLGEIYARKYWIAWLGLFRPSHEKIANGEDVLIRLTPVQ